MLAGLLWPPTVVMADVFAHGLTADTSGINSEWNDASMVEHVLHVLDGLQQVESFAGSGSLISVLVVCSQVIDSALGRCNKNNVSNSVMTGFFNIDINQLSIYINTTNF